MTVILKAPISVDEYKTYPLVKVPTGFSEDQVTTQLNNAWKTIVDKCQQPLDSTSNTETYQIGGRSYANLKPDGYLHVIPKNLPLISVTSVSWSYDIGRLGWTASAHFDTLEKEVVVYDSPFQRGEYGFVKLVYTSGYATIPDDLKEACALLTAHLLSGGMFPTQGSTGEGSVLPTWIPKDVYDTINRHKRVR